MIQRIKTNNNIFLLKIHILKINVIHEKKKANYIKLFPSKGISQSFTDISCQYSSLLLFSSVNFLFMSFLFSNSNGVNKFNEYWSNKQISKFFNSFYSKTQFNKMQILLYLLHHLRKYNKSKT